MTSQIDWLRIFVLYLGTLCTFLIPKCYYISCWFFITFTVKKLLHLRLAFYYIYGWLLLHLRLVLHLRLIVITFTVSITFPGVITFSGDTTFILKQSLILFNVCVITGTRQIGDFYSKQSLLLSSVCVIIVTRRLIGDSHQADFMPDEVQ